MMEKKMGVKIGIFALLVLLLFSAIATTFPRENMDVKSDTALGYVNGKMYAAYIDYSSLIAKIKVVDVQNKTERIISDTNWDASQLKFVKNWIMWTERRNSEKRIVWYNIIDQSKVMLNVDKNGGNILYSAKDKPTYCLLYRGNASIYEWDGKMFKLIKVVEIGNADKFFFNGIEIWYSHNEKIYNANSSTPTATFGGKVVDFTVINNTIFAAVNKNDGYDIVEYHNFSHTVIKSVNEKPYRMRAMETGDTIYLTYCREVEHGDHDYTAITLFMIKNHDVIGERDYEKSGTDYYKQSLASSNGTLYMLYLSYSNRHWEMKIDTFSNGDFQRSIEIKELQTIPTYFSIIFLMGGLFAFIFGMIPVEKKGGKVVKDEFPVHRFISYEPYMFFKPLTVIAGTLAMVLGFLSIFYSYPDMNHRLFMPASMIALSTFYSFGYILYFVREFKASPLHKVAYILAISTLLLDLWAIYMLLNYPTLLIFNTLFMASSLAFILIILVASLTMIGLIGVKNTWLMVIGLLLLSYKIFGDMIFSTVGVDFYPSVNAFYATHGEAQLTLMFVGMMFFFMAVMLVLRIPREKFKPVSRWKKEEYIEFLDHSFVVSILGSIFLLIATLYLLTVFGVWGLIGSSNSSILSGMIGMILGLAIFMAIMGRKGVDQALQSSEDMFLEPSKKIAPPVWSPTAISLSGFIAGMFIGVIAILFFVWGIYETIRAYRLIRDKIEKEFKPVSEKELERVRKEEEITEVIIDRDEMKDFIRKASLMEVKTGIGISVMLLFLWKFISYMKSISHAAGPAEWINYSLLILALLPLTAPPLFKRAVMKSKNIEELTKKGGWAEWGIAIGIINIILIGFANASPYLVILTLATSLLSLLIIHRYRTTLMLQKIDSFNDEEMKIDRMMYLYILSYLHKSTKTSEVFKESGYAKTPEKIEVSQNIPEEGYGKLLAVEPEEYRVKREKNLKNVAIAIWAISLLIPLIMFAFYNINTTAIVLVGYAAFLALGIYGIYSMRERHLEPIKIYENGIEFQNYLGVTAFFYYRGFVGSVIRRGRNIILKMVRKSGMVTRGVIAIPLWPEAEEFLPQILSRMGEEEPVKIEIKNKEKYNEAYSKLFLLIFTVLTFYSMIFIVVMMDLGLGLMTVSLFSAFIFYEAISMSIRVPMRVYGKKPEIKKTYVAVAAIVVLIILIGGYAVPFNIVSTYHAHKDMPSIGIEIISSDMTDEVINVNKSIGFAGNIMLRNVTLNVSVPNMGIYILDGASVSMENVAIRGKRWSFESYGTLVARNSTFINIWGDDDNTNQQGGMEIYENARFINCTFSNAITNAIMVFKANLTVKDSLIMNTGDEGIEGNYANITVINTRFINNTWAITTFISHLKVYDSEFINCSHGITLTDSSSGIVRDSKFENCHIAIELSYASTVQMNNVRYSNVNTTLMDNSRKFNSVCLTIAIPIVLIFMGLAYMKLRRN